MSKSKRNTVDPDDIIGEYGADVARWFMLSDSPPDRDVIWTEEGVQGSWRFVQRLWRLVREATEIAERRRNRTAGTTRRFWRCARPRTGRSPRSPRTFRGCASTAASRTSTSCRMRCRPRWRPRGRMAASAPAYAAAVREAVEIMVFLFSPMMPHLAEECWAALGHKTPDRRGGLAGGRAALLVEDTITLPVQINGKKRADVTVARDAVNAEIERAVLELEAVRRALEGKAPKKVIVVPQRIVNVVA